MGSGGDSYTEPGGAPEASPSPVPGEFQEILDRWVKAIETKDIEALSAVFRRGPDLAVFWSNGERTLGWEEVRRYVEADFRKEFDLRMDMRGVRVTRLGDDAAVLTYRYRITLSLGGDSLTFRRLASMTVHRDPPGWRVAALHVSTFPPTETPPT